MIDANDPRRRAVRGVALLPVVVLMAVRALTRLNLINIPPLNHWYVYASLLCVGFIVWLVGEWVIRRT